MQELLARRPQGAQDLRATPMLAAGGKIIKISGRAKADGLLGEEAVGLQLVAGARNHLQANRSLAFRFEVTA